MLLESQRMLTNSSATKICNESRKSEINLTVQLCVELVDVVRKKGKTTSKLWYSSKAKEELGSRVRCRVLQTN